MKQNFILSFIILALVSLIPQSIVAQENKESNKEVIEKKIRIIMVNEEGQKTIIDTLLKGDNAAGEIEIKDGLVWIDDTLSEDRNIFIKKTGDEDTYSLVIVSDDSKDEKDNIRVRIKEDHIEKEKGDIVYKSKQKEGHSYVIVMDPSEAEKKRYPVRISNDDIQEGEFHIIIRSASEIENFRIKGDAVITIKDGKISVESEGLGMNIEEKKKAKKVKK